MKWWQFLGGNIMWAGMCFAPLSDEEAAALKAEHEKTTKAKDDELAKLKADLEAARKPPADPDKDKDKNKNDDQSLADKARKEREENERKAKDSKVLESALRYDMGAKDWLKTNSTLLPKSIEGIFSQADKENYGSAIEKASAIKEGVVLEFFAVQENHDLLTASQKADLEEFKKLTKTVRQERAAEMYDRLFEPTFEQLKRIKKAHQVNRNHADQTDTEKAYGDRLQKLSRQHYLGEKKQDA